MSVQSVVLRAKAAANAIMTDTCRITRPATPDDAGYTAPALDEDTGQITEAARVTVYQGPCRMQVKADINSNVVETTAGEREWTYLTSQLQVPTVGTEGIRVDNICEILTCPGDADLVGREFNIQGTYHKSHAGYRRFRLREVVQ